MESKKDLKILEEIIKISESIALIYDKLKELEKNNQLNSDEYLKNIGYIKMLREDYENHLYQSVDLNLKKIGYLISYLKTDGLETLGDNMIHSFYPQNRVNKRVINTLFYHMAFEPCIVKEVTYRLLFLKELSEKNFADIVTNYTNLYRSITNDKDYSILVLLIENQRLEEKYNYMFTNRCLEEKLLGSNFRVMKPILYESYSLDIDFNIVQNFIDVFFNHSIAQEIKQLQKIDDSIFEGNHLKIQSRLIILRALFMLVSPDKLMNINYDYHSFIEGRKYIMNHPNNNKVDAAISGAFRKIDSDKKMILK